MLWLLLTSLDENLSMTQLIGKTMRLNIGIFGRFVSHTMCCLKECISESRWILNLIRSKIDQYFGNYSSD